jgi:hypothetical protein
MRTTVKHTATRLSIAAAASALVIAASGCASGFITSAPINVTDTSATLQGSVASNLNTDGTYWFEYGETKDYGHSTPHQPITFASNVKKPVSETVKELSGWNDYHYRLCANDNDPQAPGPHCSGDEKFTTSDPQITLGPDRPRYTLHIAAGDGSSNDPQSGIASVAVTVDGTPVDNPPGAPGCPADNCNVDEDWTFRAADYGPGEHTVTVTATDRVGHPTSKQLEIDVEDDTTKPSLRASGPLASAPEGWVDQKNYTVTAESADSGYGVTSLKLMVDDQLVGQAVTQDCGDGGCSLSHTFSVNAANYTGGAHEVRLVATDGAGNDTTKSWTMNVNPSGTIDAHEAADTLQAVDSTSDTANVARTDEIVDAAEMADGYNPGLSQTGVTLHSTGTDDETTMTSDPADGFTIHAPRGGLQVTPVGVGDDASTTAVTAGAVGLSANTATEVDSGIRPVYNGDMTFEAIRDRSASGQFSWRVSLDTDQTLKSIDAQHAEIYWGDGTAALGISAYTAHDATGATVPTSLSVSNGNVITLTVSHQSGSYVYPISAGQGWEAPYIAPITPDPGIGNCPHALPDQRAYVCAAPSAHAVASAPDFARVRDRNLYVAWCGNDEPGVDGCDIWKASISGSFTRYIDNHKNGFDSVRQVPGSTISCNTDGGHSPIWPHPPYVNTHIFNLGWVGTQVAFEGTGDHLTAYCHFKISIPPPFVWIADVSQCYALQAWVWPSGRQVGKLKKWDGGNDHQVDCNLVT